MQFDFSQDAINATSTKLALAPGDKMLWVKRDRRTGAAFKIRCILARPLAPGKLKATVNARYVSRQTGQVIEQAHSVELRNLYRHDWTEGGAA